MKTTYSRNSLHFMEPTCSLVGRVAQSVQRLATNSTVRGLNPGEGEIFRTCPDRPWGPHSLLYNGYRVFPGGKERPGSDADSSSFSSAVVKKEQSYTSNPPMCRTTCIEPQCLYKGALFYMFITAFTNARRLSQLSARSIQSMPPHPTS